MNAVWEALANTPWWVYALLVFFVSRGIKARRPAIVSPAKLALVPAIMLVWGGWSLVTLFPVNPLTLGSWVISMVLGAVFGLWLFQNVHVRVDRERGLLWRPGDPTFLPLVLAIFAAKYVFGYLAGVEPAVVRQPAYYLTDIVVSGVITGVFLGKLAMILHKYREAPSEKLPFSDE